MLFVRTIIKPDELLTMIKHVKADQLLSFNVFLSRFYVLADRTAYFLGEIP